MRSKRGSATCLGLLESLASSWLEATLGRYHGPDPLELSEGSERELATALRSGAIDASLTLVEGGPGPVLLEEDYCLILAAGHSLAGSAVIHAEEVAGETMIARRACEMLAETSRYFTERGVRPRFLLRSGNDDRVMALIRAGLGVTVAPRSFGGPGLAVVGLSGFDRHRRIGLQFGEHWRRQYGSDHPILSTLVARSAD
jgi:DNA-binding transcriptional LysR family regulator